VNVGGAELGELRHTVVVVDDPGPPPGRPSTGRLRCPRCRRSAWRWPRSLPASARPPARPSSLSIVLTIGTKSARTARSPACPSLRLGQVEDRRRQFARPRFSLGCCRPAPSLAPPNANPTPARARHSAPGPARASIRSPARADPFRASSSSGGVCSRSAAHRRRGGALLNDLIGQALVLAEADAHGPLPSCVRTPSRARWSSPGAARCTASACCPRRPEVPQPARTAASRISAALAASTAEIMSKGRAHRGSAGPADER